MLERNDASLAGVDRRQFLAGLSAGAVGAGLAGAAVADESGPDAAAVRANRLIDSPPVLQNPSSTAVTVVWAVNAPATGWVECGPTEQLGQRADLPRHGLNPLHGRFLSARINGLEPGKPVYYRVVSVPVNFKGPYQIERGEPVAGPVYRFTPPHPAAEAASFAVINDTHERTETLAALTKRLAADAPDFTVWNGDVFNDVRSDDQVVANVLRPAGAAYAAERPVLFTSGNHDVRGVHARALAHAISPWQREEPVGRCFAVRHGPLALIGLDTGEDKPDRHPAWAGLANFEPYREAQAQWLRRALARPEVASAPFVVAFCHIPLWGLPGDNPGDTLEGYAAFCRHAQRLWHPHLQAAGVQLLVSGHTHRHRYDAPADGRGYGQLVGGGPRIEQATIIRGRASRDRLEVDATDLAGRTLGTWRFQPRAKS